MGRVCSGLPDPCCIIGLLTRHLDNRWVCTDTWGRLWCKFNLSTETILSIRKIIRLLARKHANTSFSTILQGALAYWAIFLSIIFWCIGLAALNNMGSDGWSCMAGCDFFTFGFYWSIVKIVFVTFPALGLGASAGSTGLIVSQSISITIFVGVMGFRCCCGGGDSGPDFEHSSSRSALAI